MNPRFLAFKIALKNLSRNIGENNVSICLRYEIIPAGDQSNIIDCNYAGFHSCCDKTSSNPLGNPGTKAPLWPKRREV